IMVASRKGKCITFKQEDVRPMGRDTAGVKAMKLVGKDRIVDMIVVDKEKDILTVSENGYGKRTDPSAFRAQGRAGKGIKAGTFNELTGALVSVKQVTDEDDAMLISDGGTIIRMHCSDISRIGRASRGVRLMRLKNGVVATVALTERDDEAETQAPEESAADVPEEPENNEEE
ncbi:MAG: DNA gyrase subunit A, partial [Clostridia bacterium]|nr:DNA gyrase subunit A [Clostridia bacterium]